MATREPAFVSSEEEREYLTKVKAELDACQSKADVVRAWQAHYLKIGHRKLGRLLLGRGVDEIMKAKG